MTQDLLSVQYLRALAAMMVVLVHVEGHLTRLGYVGGWPPALHGGVDIFFVTSGFIMWVTTVKRTLTPSQFLRFRLQRILPLYWIITTLAVALMVVLPTLYQSGQLSFVHVLTSYLFIPSEHPLLHTMVPVLLPGWTLNYEMFFYLIFAGCLWLAPNRRILVLIGILVGLAVLHRFVPDQWTIASYWTEDIILEFAFGALLGVLYARGRTIPDALALGLFIVGALCMIAAQYVVLPRSVGSGVPAVMILAGAIYLERNHELGRWSALGALGDASYSLYLVHGLTLSFARQVWQRVGLAETPDSFPMFVVFALAVSCLLALLTYRLVERPLLAAFRRQGRPVVAPA